MTKVKIKQFKNKAKEPVAGLTPEHAIYDTNGIRLDAKLGNVNLQEMRDLQQQSVNAIKAQQTTSTAAIEAKKVEGVNAVESKKQEILNLTDAALISANTKGLEGSNVQANLNDASNKLSELEQEAYNLSVYLGGISGNVHYHNGVMQTDGKCGDINSAKHVLIKVKEGDTIVVQGKNSADVSHFAMLTDYFVPQKNGDTFPLVSGESRQVIGGVEKTYTIKPSCKYIYITTFNNDIDVTPITMSVNGVDMVRSIREALKDSMTSLSEEIQQEKDIRISQNTQLTNLISNDKKIIEENETYSNVSFNAFRGKNCIVTFNGVITDNGTIVDYDTAKHSVITCAEGSLLYIKSDSSSTERCLFAFLSSYERVTYNGQKLSVIGSRQTASINGTTVIAPEGSKYLLFFTYNNGKDCLPVELTIDKYDVLKGVTKSISDINNALSDGSLVGKSAYEIAKEHGFVGTEQKWLESLQGKDGKDGKDGSQGLQGLQGNSGYSGAVGELEVVNNITSGGATSALSAEMGKQIGNFIDYNNVPLQPQTKNPAELSSCEINSSKWVVTSSADGTTTSTLVDVYDEVYQDTKHCVELNSTRNARFVSRLGTPVSMAFNVIRCSLCIMKDVDVSKIQTLIFEVYSDGYTDSSHRAEFPVQYANPSEDSGNYNAQYVRGGWFHFCINPNSRINSKGASFNINNVTHVGLHLQHENGYTLKVYVAHLSVVKGLKKPGIIHIIDNFDSDVPAMADYAYSKGIKLNLSIIPNWIGGESSASLDEINRIKKQGHLIFDHTFNHIADTSGTTEEEIVDEIINGVNWMERNGFARGAKIISNPSARFPFDKYKAYMESPAQMIFHHWTTMPGSPSSNGNVLLYYPFYPMTRLLNISALAGNEPTQKTSYLNNMKASIDAAATFGGIAVLGSHGTFWAMDNGASWKEVIDYASSRNLYSYGIDEIIEGCFI